MPLIWKKEITLIIMLLLFSSVFSDWTQYTRVVGFRPNTAEPDMDTFLDWAKAAGANTVVIRQDVVSDYDWLIKKDYADAKALLALNKVIRACQARGMYAVVNLSALSVKTKKSDVNNNGVLDTGKNSLFGDHPDWVQENINGNPAVFYGQSGTEVVPEDEIAWASPMSDDYKNLFFPLVKDVAKLLPDGISFENLHYMSEGAWTHAWGPFGEVSVSNFTGTLPGESSLGDFSNADFRAWLDYRLLSISVFAQEAAAAVKEVHADIKTMMIAKGGISNRASAYGYDHLTLSEYFDVMIHEFHPFGISATMNTYEWMFYFAGVKLLVDLNPGKATWIISYANGGGAEARDAEESPDRVQTLMQTVVQSGANQWTTGGKSKYYTSTNVSKTFEMNAWISSNEEWLFGDRTPAQSVAVYFSPASHKFRSGDSYSQHLASLYGTLMILHENNISSHVITSRDLNIFNQLEMPMVVVPDVACASTEERDSLAALADYYEVKVLVSGSDNNNCDESGAGTAEDFNAPFVKFMKISSVTKARDYFHNSVFAEDGSRLSRSYPDNSAESTRMTWDDEMKYNTKISFNVFELPSTAAIRVVKSPTSTYYHMLNFGGLDNLDLPRDMDEEIILTRNGDSLGIIGYQVPGGQLNVLTNHKPAYNLQEITLTEDLQVSSAVVQATLIGEPEVTGQPGVTGDPVVPDEPPVVVKSDRFKEFNYPAGPHSGFHISSKIIRRGDVIHMNYFDGTNSLENVAVKILALDGTLKSEIELLQKTNVFTNSVSFGDDNNQGSGTYAYNVVSDNKSLSNGILVLK